MIVTLKRKQYSDNGPSVGQKLAMGAATIGGGLLMAKKGYMGAGLQKTVNKGLIGAGTKMAGASNKAISGLGDKFITSGAKGYGDAIKTQTFDKAIAGGTNKVTAGRQAIAAGNRAENAAMNAAINKI